MNDVTVRNSIKMGMATIFKLEKFKEGVSTLGELNSLLRQMRKSAQRKRASTVSQRKLIPKEFKEVRKVTTSLHGILSRHWSCENTSHAQHIFCLLVNPDIGNDIRLKAVVESNAAEAGRPTDR